MRRILITVCILSLFFSCSDDDSDNQEPQNDNFYALTVGNSWEYRWYTFHPENGLNPTNVTNSISIIGTEEINGNLFYKFKKVVSGNDGTNITSVPDGEYFEFYRDSLGFLVNNYGTISFVNSTTDEFQLYETEVGFPHTGYAKLSENTVDFTTEAGTFECLEMSLRFESEDYEIPAINRRYYANGIGLIKDEEVFLADPNSSGFQRRLESYNVQ